MEQLEKRGAADQLYDDSSDEKAAVFHHVCLLWWRLLSSFHSDFGTAYVTWRHPFSELSVVLDQLAADRQSCDVLLVLRHSWLV